MKALESTEYEKGLKEAMKPDKNTCLVGACGIEKNLVNVSI